MTPLTLVVTTYNNAATLPRCLDSVSCADEILVLDSGSSDDTAALAQSRGARLETRPFDDYGPQKQHAIELAGNDWILLLDADEALTGTLDRWIGRQKRDGFDADGYELPRFEQVFWRMQSRWSRPNYQLRLFDRRLTRMNEVPVHAAPVCRGRVRRLGLAFVHYGEPDIHTKVEKINRYSTGMAPHRLERGKGGNPWIMVFYPPLQFLRLYVFRRQFLNGWAGFVNAAVGAFYVFLKYAKVYEARRAGERKGPPDKGTPGTSG